ncbi:O-GlcNAc transferase [Suillus lakei]|nr:O-GlcNAc transferase [Suillus lakei]
MKSVFRLHDRNRFCVFLYATSPSDGSVFRLYFEQGDFNFLDVSSWSNVDIVNRIEEDHIHILVDLGGYTRGARNEIFAARPSPVQVSLMGYAGTLAASWCDYLVCDSITCPVDLFARVQAYRKRNLNNCCQNSDMGVSHTYFVTDHRQSFRHGENLSVEERAQTPAEKLWNDELKCRTDLRRALFPDLPSDQIDRSRESLEVFDVVNRSLSSCQNIFATWLHILARVPRSILWLLRFPAAGEAHLIQTAKEWAGEEIASRIRFTDVAAKDHHIYRCRVPDLFLDTSEVEIDSPLSSVLWAGTPLIACAWPSHRHKMSSRVAASLASATGREEYEERAVALGNSMRYIALPNGDVEASGDLLALRRCLFLNRDTMPLFDTERWTRNLEKAYRMAWRRWVDGSMFRMCDDGCIWVKDDVDIPVRMG